MKEIGGYIELEFKKGQTYHSDAIALNTARNCFEYILRAKKIKKIFIPHYTCEVMLEPINKLGVDFAYYHVNENLEPILTDQILQNFPVLYTNYFGIKQTFVKDLFKKCKSLIIDNSQAFYHFQVESIDTIYSARKFFGVPDGAYLYTDKIIPESEIEQDFSHNRSAHLIKRIELGSNEAYQLFLENDSKLYNQPIRKMSAFTRTILANIDYENSQAIRERNFLYLHNILSKKNELKIDLSDFSGPMFYPLLFKHETMRQIFLGKKIYVPTLWKNVLNTTRKDDFEQYLAIYLFPLPVDQRYEIKDMDRIINCMKSCL